MIVVTMMGGFRFRGSVPQTPKRLTPIESSGLIADEQVGAFWDHGGPGNRTT